MEKTVEQEARELLKRMGILQAEHFSSGELVELANLISAVKYPQRSNGEHELHRQKMKCGCWTYRQRGTGMEVYSLLIHDSCISDHEVSVSGKGGPGVTTTLTAGTKIVEDRIESPPAELGVHLSRN